VSVRLVGDEPSYSIPSFGTRPHVVVAPNWAFVPVRAPKPAPPPPKPEPRERKRKRGGARKDKLASVAQEVLHFEPLAEDQPPAASSSDALRGLEEQRKVDHEMACDDASSLVGEVKVTVPLAGLAASHHNVVHLKRHPRKPGKNARKRGTADSDSDLDRSSDADIQPAAKRPRASATDLHAGRARDTQNTGNDFKMIKRLISADEKLEVFWTLEKDPAVVVWRATVAKDGVHEDTQTFDVKIVEHGAVIRNVQPSLLQKRTALAV